MKTAHRFLIVSLTALAVTGLFCLSQPGSHVVHAQSGCTPPPANMVAWWPGDGNPLDIQGGNHGTLFNGATFAPGMVAQGFSLDGVNDYVEIPHNSAFNVSSLTLDAWVNTDTLAGTEGRTIVSKYNNSGGAGQASWLFLMLPDGRLRFDVYQSGSAFRLITTNNLVMAVGTWQHVAATFDLATQAMRIYVNGAEVPTTLDPSSITITGIQQNTVPVRIGTRVDVSGFAAFWDGLIDEVEMFNRALTQSEIQAIFNAGSAGKCRPCIPSPAQTVGWWPGDGNALDIQGGNHGTLQNGATFAPGKVAQAFNFDGVNDALNIPHNSNQNIQGSFSAEAWIFPRSLPNVAPRVFDKESSGGNLWSMHVNNDGTLINSLSARINSTFVTTPNNSIPLNQWSHVAFTYNGISGELKAFINGAQADSTTGSIQTTTGSAPLFIGNDVTGTRQFDGLIDEPAIYNRLLNASEIAAIFSADSLGKCKPNITFAVTNTSDSGAGSLRDAINQANLSPGLDAIKFNIPGSGVQTIIPPSALPTITSPVIIDGYTQPGASANTLTNGDDAVLLIELNGMSAGTGVRGLTITAGNSTVRGLVINRCGLASDGKGILLQTNGGNLIEGNFIGTNAAGTARLGNDHGVYVDNSPNNRIGGTGPAARNIISANGDGVVFFRTTGNLLQGNFIGTDKNGTADLGNEFQGVDITSASNSSVGGPSSGAGNIIAFNGTLSGQNRPGVLVATFDSNPTANSIRGNSIFSNAGVGIDMVTGAFALGVTPNDSCDTDSGPNNLQNFPAISSVTRSGGNLTINGTLNSTAGTTFTIDFYSNTSCDGSGNGEGQIYLGSTTATTNGSCTASFSVTLPAAGGDAITATATDPAGSTSEFSQCFSAPTAIKLASFTATAYDDGQVLLEWQTGYEADNLGFNIYRDEAGRRTLVNPSLLAGSALLAGPRTVLSAGQSYVWADTLTGDPATRYWLEDIDLNGTSTLNGPYAISDSPPKSAKEAQKRSQLISQIGMRQGLLANGLGSAPLARAATLATATAAALQLQSGLASQPAVKIAVKQEGYYRVTQAELVRAGLDPKVDPRLLQLFVEGVEQPIKVTGEQDGRFDASDAVEFYGVGLDTTSTDTRVYWLVASAKPGKRITITHGKGDPIASSGFPFTVERKDRTIYFSALLNGETENFFGAVVASQPVDQSLWLQHLDQTSQAPASIEVSLQGVTQLPHNVRVQVNGTDVTRLTFTGQSQVARLVSISPSLLREGENQVRLIAEGGPSDVSLVDVIRISYSHSYLADSDALRLTAQEGQQVNVSGFTRKDIRLMDVTDANAPQEIAATVIEGKNGNTVSGTAAGSGTRALLAFADSQTKHPWSITANQPSSLRQPGNGADMLIITQRDYFSTVASLKSLRESQGLSVAVVDIEDIYDEFSFGNSTPQDVREFSAYAATNWKKKPRFVLLAGDASYDPKNYLGFGDFDLVPTKLLDTAYMETASDDWFADFDSDGVPELAVGRLPFRSAAEASTMITKIIGYERSSPSEEVLLVADTNDGFDFEAASAQLVGTMPANLKINQINRRSDTAAAKARLMEAINRGQKLVNYAGHGSVNQWRGNLLVNEDASQMRNTDHLSVFVMMTCLNGYFDDPALDSLAESLLKADRGGAVAVWSSSGMTLPAEQAQMNQGLYRSLFSPERIPLLGDAVREAKATIVDVDIRRTWVLLGDPAMKLR